VPTNPPREPPQLACPWLQRGGTTTTPFDLTVLNDLDRFHLAGNVIDRVPRLQAIGGHFKQFLRDKLVEHSEYIRQHGDDLPEVRDWVWRY
jgi:xylulose-5-phosphate/fructose-6-phosphate phosphoketolase